VLFQVDKVVAVTVLLQMVLMVLMEVLETQILVEAEQEVLHLLVVVMEALGVQGLLLLDINIKIRRLLWHILQK
jgi:hypothetical protein